MKIKGFLWGLLKGNWGIWDGVGGGRKLYYKNWGIGESLLVYFGIKKARYRIGHLAFLVLG
jgi:hypothetical protein